MRRRWMNETIYSMVRCLLRLFSSDNEKTADLWRNGTRAADNTKAKKLKYIAESNKCKLCTDPFIVGQKYELIRIIHLNEVGLVLSKIPK